LFFANISHGNFSPGSFFLPGDISEWPRIYFFLILYLFTKILSSFWSENICFFENLSLKATIVFLSILLIKSNLLRLKGGLIGGLFALILISGIFASSTLALGSLVYAYRLKNKSNSDDNQIQDLETVNV